MGIFDRNSDDSPKQPQPERLSIAEQRAAARPAPQPAQAPVVPVVPVAPAGGAAAGVPSAPVDQVTVRQLSMEGITRAANAEGWKYEVENGKMMGMWDYNHFLFVVTGGSGEYFQIQSQWKGTVPPERFEEVRRFSEEWHRAKLWPTISFTTADGAIKVNTTLSVDYEYGVTDAQLLLQMRCALATSLKVYEELNGMFGLAEGPVPEA